MLQFHVDADFGTEQHRLRREDGWIGGAFIELPYFLSCLTKIDFVRTPLETWDPACRSFVTECAPDSAWIIRSRYFYDFAVLILRELYRQSELGKRHQTRCESRQERAVREGIRSPELSLAELASQLGTTEKQLQRNSTLMLALREYRLVHSGKNPH